MTLEIQTVTWPGSWVIAPILSACSESLQGSSPTVKFWGDLRHPGLANQDVPGHCHWITERHALQAQPMRTLLKSTARNLEPPRAISATTWLWWLKNEANADGRMAEVLEDSSHVCIQQRQLRCIFWTLLITWVPNSISVSGFFLPLAIKRLLTNTWISC